MCVISLSGLVWSRNCDNCEVPKNELITEDTARLYSTRKGTVTRGIDLIQKGRGVDSEIDSGLRMDTPENAFR